MQKEIKPGTLYFLKGKEEGRGRELIAGLRQAGYRLLIVSPRDPETVMHDLEVSPECVLTLSETVGPYSVDPQNLMVLTDTITKFFELGGKSVLLMEDLRLLKQKNEFPRVLRLVGFIYESVALHRGISFIMIDPQGWDEKEMAHLGKEGSIVEEKERIDIGSLRPSAAKTSAVQNV